MRICLFFLITVFLMACSSTGNQRQEPENQTLGNDTQSQKRT